MGVKKTTLTISQTDSSILINFIDAKGEIIQQRLGRNLPIPDVGEKISFGKIHQKTEEPEEPEETEERVYHMSDHAYVVVGIEYDFPEYVTDGSGYKTDISSIITIEIEPIE